MEAGLTCENHGQKCEQFCPDHDRTVCKNCVEENHKLCKNLVSIETIAKGFKSSDAFSDLEKSLKDAKQNIKNALHSITENKTSLILCKSSIRQEIQILRKELYEQIDKMETKLLQETETQYKTCLHKLDNTTRTMKENNNFINRLLSATEEAKILNSSKEAYLQYRNIDKQFLITKSKLDDFLKDHKKYEMSVRFDPTVAAFREKVTALGEVEIKKTANPITIQDFKTRQAQVPVNPIARTRQDTVFSRKQVIPILPKLNDHIITSCLILPNERFIFIHRNYNGLFIQDVYGSVQHTLNIASGPYDADVLDDTRLAISFGSLARVEVIDIKTGNVFRKYPTEGFCSGICCGHGNVYVLVKGRGVCKISLTQGLTSLIRNPSFDMGFVDASSDKLVVTNTKDRTVCCYDLHGHELWSLHLDDGIPRGVQFDKSGNVFLIDSKSDTLKQVSHDRQEIKVLLKETDGLNTPFGIYCDKTSNQVLICNLLDGKAFLYRCR